MILNQWWIDMRARLTALFRRKEIYNRADEELQFHLTMLEQRMIESGISPNDARILAQRQLGNATRIKEQSLDAWRYTFMDTLIRDFRFALRRLMKNVSFVVTAVLTLALGIGATTAIFSVVYSVLIKPLPYPKADELVRIRHSDIDGERSFSETMYLTYREENRTFASIGLWHETAATLTDRGEPELVRALRVTDGTLQALGIQPMRGRWFTKQEYGPVAEGPEPVILSYAFWQRRFGGEEAVLGREITMEAPSGARASPLAAQWQVVGIMPRSFRFLDMAPQPEVIVAMRLNPARETINSFSYDALARLAPGVTAAGARADLERMLPIWLDAWPIQPGGSTKEAIANWRITPVVVPLKDDLVGGVATTLWVLMGAIGAVLLIACANIANLMLVRADARRQEFAVRAALGAAPAGIARELVVEGLVLGAAGSVLGLGLAYVGVQFLVAMGPSDLPRLEEIAVYAPVLAFTVAMAMASTVVFSAIPALKHALQIDTPMTGSPRASTGSPQRSAARSALVIVQVALALVLVVSAALMIRTFQALRDIDLGFSDPATIQTAGIAIPFTQVSDPEQVARVAKMTSLQREILDRLAALPGVASVGFANDLPMGGGQWNGPVLVEGETLAAGETPPSRRWNFVSPGYFEAIGTRMIAGRDITWSDIEAGGRVAVISEDFAREIAIEPAAAVGRRIRLRFDQAGWDEVVGVVQQVHQDGLLEGMPSMAYWPVLTSHRLFGRLDGAFVIRSDRAGTAALRNEVRQAVRSVNGSIPMTREGTMRDLYAASFARTSFTLVMLAIAGGMALALGAVGIYGVISYVVAQRTREIGIRLALGARPRHLERMFLLHGLALSGVGAVVGLVTAMGLGRLMSSLLFGIGPMDPVAYVAALVITITASALASYLPARRAAAISPSETLKNE
jgi:predicted permease